MLNTWASKEDKGSLDIQKLACGINTDLFLVVLMS